MNGRDSQALHASQARELGIAHCGFDAESWHNLAVAPDEGGESEDNPTTPAKVELGKKLFFDPRLSLTGTVSCNSCHNLMEGGDDGRPTSMGDHGRLGPRNANTVWNSVFQASQFWDGWSPSLEDQAKGPIVAVPEMGMPTLAMKTGEKQCHPRGNLAHNRFTCVQLRPGCRVVSVLAFLASFCRKGRRYGCAPRVCFGRCGSRSAGRTFGPGDAGRLRCR